MPKTCSRCALEKPLNGFYKQAGGTLGRRGMCKECFRAAERASYASEDSKMPKQMPAQCGQCGGSMELLEEGDDYLLAQCLLCQTKLLDPPRRAQHIYLAEEPSRMDAEFISKGPLMPRSLRGWLYFIARLMGHIAAVKRGRVGRFFGLRAAGKVTGRSSRRCPATI